MEGNYKKIKANYVQIICKASKDSKEVIWTTESEAVCPENKVTLTELVARVLKARDVVLDGETEIEEAYTDEAESLIRRG